MNGEDAGRWRGGHWRPLDNYQASHLLQEGLVEARELLTSNGQVVNADQGYTHFLQEDAVCGFIAATTCNLAHCAGPGPYLGPADPGWLKRAWQVPH